MLTILAPAKINLFLHVTGRRSDGYHELFTLMCPLTLFDRVRITPISKGIRVRCNHPRVPEDDTNLAHRAAVRFARETIARGKGPFRNGFQIAIQKRIPVGAGLGGGSSDAAAVFCGLNRIYHHPFSSTELMQMGRDIGADVPFFVQDRPALATGIGDRLQTSPKLPPLAVLLIDPGIFVSTAEVYKNLDLGLTNCQKKHKDLPLEFRPSDLATRLCNDLETVTLNAHPEISEAKRALVQNGALAALMSGSGSAVFGLFDSRGKALRARAAIGRAQSWRMILAELAVDGIYHPGCRKFDGF